MSGRDDPVMHRIGPIVRLQVQVAPLKTRGSGYDPSGILAVEEVAIGPQGVVGHHQGTWVVDVHHGAHPFGRAGGRRALSVGFTGHYERMASRFGAAPLGCAGENLIVAAGGRIMVGDLAGALHIRGASGSVAVRRARVAAPCAEFTSWIKGLDVVVPIADQRDDVAFLDDGMRGFILDVSHLERPALVRVGDEVWVSRQSSASADSNDAPTPGS